MNMIAPDPVENPFMQLALEQAQLALAPGEVPVGAVVVHAGEVVGRGHNATISQNDPCAHAEVVALRDAGRQLGNYRLDDCDVYVTLEPCMMCCGAMLHARVRRVFFGAHDAKTGAAGSVFNAFADHKLNHHTTVTGGMDAAACAALLTGFFQTRRRLQRNERLLTHPLRDDALRTPETQFSELADYPWSPRYVHDLPSLNGLRLHYLDEGPHDAPWTILLVHDCPAWSYAFRHAIPVFLHAGYRVVAPDLIGFGKSDKPKHEKAHTRRFHAQVLHELVDRLQLDPVYLIAQDAQADLGAALADTPPSVVRAALVVDCREPQGQLPGWVDVPFPNPGYRAALRACQNDRCDRPATRPTTRFRTPSIDVGVALVDHAVDLLRLEADSPRVNPGEGRA